MIPIPKYLRDIATKTKEKNENLTMNITCTCGCNNFIVFKNIPHKANITKEQRKLVNRSNRWYMNVWYNLFGGGILRAAYYDYKEQGYREMIVYDSSALEGREFDKELDKDKIVHYFKINAGEFPLSYKEMEEIDPRDDNVIIKARCAQCSKEYVLFDNRIYGCDSADFENKELEEYEFKERVLNKNEGKSYRIEISLKNYWDFDDVKSNGNEGFTADDYSNLFNYINIKAIDECNKKIKIYSEELG